MEASDFPVGARVGYSQHEIARTSRAHGPQWGRGKANARGTVTGHAHGKVGVRWDGNRAAMPDRKLPEDLQIIGGAVSGMPAAAAAASLEGAFRQAAGAMGFQPPWGQAGLGAFGAAKKTSIPTFTTVPGISAWVNPQTDLYGMRLKVRGGSVIFQIARHPTSPKAWAVLRTDFADRWSYHGRVAALRADGTEAPGAGAKSPRIRSLAAAQRAAAMFVQRYYPAGDGRGGW